MFIKSLPPDHPTFDWNYTRFGVVIPKEFTEIKTLKEFFEGSPLSEEKLLNAIRDDNRVAFETDNDREAREAAEKLKDKESAESKAAIEIKSKKEKKKQTIDKKIEAFNEEKEKAIETETKEDDLIIAEKEKELMKEIQEVDNGKE